MVDPLHPEKPLPCPSPRTMPSTDAPAAGHRADQPRRDGEAAAELVQQHPAEQISAKIEVFDWLMEKQESGLRTTRPAIWSNPSPTTMPLPKVSSRKPSGSGRGSPNRPRTRADAEASRRKQQEAARERAEDEAVAAYRKALTPDELARHEADAIAQASDGDAEAIWTIRHDAVRKTLVLKLTDKYIRQIIRNRQSRSSPSCPADAVPSVVWLLPFPLPQHPSSRPTGISGPILTPS